MFTRSGRPYANEVSSALLILGVLTSAGRAGTDVTVADRFGRRVNDVGITLVDWEGYLANPAIELSISPPTSATFPATVILSGDNARLYFQLPSTVGEGGPEKTLVYNSGQPQTVKLSIFPDRDFHDEEHSLTIDFSDNGGLAFQDVVAINVVDQDADQPVLYDVTVDYTKDLSGFFSNADHRVIVEQAVRDWFYFLDDQQTDTVDAFAQSTWIWNYPLAWTGPSPNGHFVSNASAYDGFLLYAYGIDTSEIRSGGEPSTCCFHTSGGAGTTLRRSGGVEIEVKGNFNTLGWFLTTGDSDWWVSQNFGGEPNDLYSIAHHEFGHALAFNSGYPGFATGETGSFSSPALTAYFGGPVVVNGTFDHFENIEDPASGRGIFGNEYFGPAPRRRWLITKLDLLLLEAVGYAIRSTSALESLTVQSGDLHPATVDMPYDVQLTASGGVPAYDWAIVGTARVTSSATMTGGSLPDGLSLDRFTGRITGAPNETGQFAFEIEVRDNSNAPPSTANLNLFVEEGEPIPTVSEWGLVAMTLLVLTAGTVVLKRRRSPVRG